MRSAVIARSSTDELSAAVRMIQTLQEQLAENGIFHGSVTSKVMYAAEELGGVAVAKVLATEELLEVTFFRSECGVMSSFLRVS